MLCKNGIRVVLAVILTAATCAWSPTARATPSGQAQTPRDVPQASFYFSYDESRKDGIDQLLAGSHAETRQACVEFAPEAM